MGRAKSEQSKEQQHIKHLPKCTMCGDPVEGYSETLCSECRKKMERD